jgi:hypothetical protein
MNLVENDNQLSQVFNKYEISKIDFKEKLTIVLPNNVNEMLFNFLSNIDQSLQHKYVGSVNINQYNIYNDIEAYNILLDATHYANKIINESGMKILSSNTNIWKIFIYTNMMWDLPFTLEDVIFLPFNIIEQCKEQFNNNNFSLITTLIHEKIHVLQRSNVNEWINYIYIMDKNWIKYDDNTNLFKFLNSYDIDKLIEFMIVKNPDVIYNNFKYVYKHKNRLYYAILYLNKDNYINTQWFLINEINNETYDKQNVSFTLEKSEEFILPHEHPFEIYAYKIANELTSSK